MNFKKTRKLLNPTEFELVKAVFDDCGIAYHIQNTTIVLVDGKFDGSANNQIRLDFCGSGNYRGGTK